MSFLKSTSLKSRPLRSILIVCCVALLVVACGGGDEEAADTDGLQIALLPAADGMAGETLGVQLANADGTPITDATVAVEGNMNHAGMVPVMADAVTDDADGSSDGIYYLPFQFSMLGDWIITVTVEQADGTTITRGIEATVGEDGITVAAPAASMAAMDHGDMDHGDMDHGDNDHDAMMAEHAGQLMVYDISARPAPVAGGTGGVYLTIHNDGDADDQLIGVDTTIAQATELHETINDNNVMRMEHRPDGFPIPAGEELVLEPGGKHIMLIDLAQPLAEGDTFSLTLNFAEAEPIVLDVTVGPMSGTPEMGTMEGMDHSTMTDTMTGPVTDTMPAAND